MMNKLKTYKFSELYEMSSGISSKKEQAGHGSPFLSFSTVFNNEIIPDELQELMDTSDKEKQTYSIKEGDIFLTRTSETLDELGMSCVAIKDYPNASYSGFLKRLRPTQKDITYAKFMAFYLRGYLFRKAMNNNAIMTLRASLNEQIFSYLDLILPPYAEQVKIGDLFYKISKKIEVNNKINQKLEAMAKTLYDYWFVQFDFPFDFTQGKPDKNGKPYKSSGGKMVFNEELKREIPEGWEVLNLNDIESNIITGKTPLTKVKENFDGDIPFITIDDIRQSLYIYKTDRTLTELGAQTQQNKFLHENDICVSCIGTIGEIGFVGKLSQSNQQINTISKPKNYNRFFLFHYLKNYFTFNVGAKKGAVLSNMNKSEFESIRVLDAPIEIKKEYYKIVDSTFKNLSNNIKENQKLSELRDWLLPMLMNGQVSVGEVEEKLGMVAEERAEYNKK